MYIETNTNTNGDKYLGEIERVEARPVSVVEQVQVGLDLIVLLFGLEIILFYYLDLILFLLLFGLDFFIWNYICVLSLYSWDATVII